MLYYKLGQKKKKEIQPSGQNIQKSREVKE
jgi:hypothetical protein